MLGEPAPTTSDPDEEETTRRSRAPQEPRRGFGPPPGDLQRLLVPFVITVGAMAAVAAGVTGIWWLASDSAARPSVLSQGERAIAEQRWEDAAALFARVLQEQPDSEPALTGLTRADAEIRSRVAYEAGRARYRTHPDELDEIFDAFSRISPDSAYRTRAEVRDTIRRYADRQIGRARRAASSEPRDALRIVAELDALPDLPADRKRQLEPLRREADRALDSLERTAPPTAAPPSALDQSPMETARDCLNRGDEWCVIRALQGRTAAGEMRLLISTYRALRDTGSTIREMRRYIARYPNDSYANMYRQFLAAHGQ